MTIVAFTGSPPSSKEAGTTMRRATLFAVSLIDRRTGKPHRVNGSALVLFSRDPDDAKAELLAGRDPEVWDVEVEPLGPNWRD